MSRLNNENNYKKDYHVTPFLLLKFIVDNLRVFSIVDIQYYSISNKRSLNHGHYNSNQ